jgi:hypothetical protein
MGIASDVSILLAELQGNSDRRVVGQLQALISGRKFKWPILFNDALEPDQIVTISSFLEDAAANPRSGGIVAATGIIRAYGTTWRKVLREFTPRTSITAVPEISPQPQNAIATLIGETGLPDLSGSDQPPDSDETNPGDDEHPRIYFKALCQKTFKRFTYVAEVFDDNSFEIVVAHAVAQRQDAQDSASGVYRSTPNVHKGILRSYSSIVPCPHCSSRYALKCPTCDAWMCWTGLPSETCPSCYCNWTWGTSSSHKNKVMSFEVASPPSSQATIRSGSPAQVGQQTSLPPVSSTIRLR